MNLFEKAALPTVLKRLMLKHAAAQIMIELFNLLRTRAEMRKFKDTACQLVGMAMPPEETDTAATPGTDGTARTEVTEGSGCLPDPAPTPSLQAPQVARCEESALEELVDLKGKMQKQEAELTELRSKLASSIDVRLERKQVEEEQTRADDLHRQVVELQKERQSLREQLRETRQLEPELERVRGRVVRSVQKINESLQVLQGDEAKASGRALSMASLDSLTDWDDEADSIAGSFRTALSRLDSLVVALPSAVEDAAAEMQQLKQRCDELETTSMAPTADPEETRQMKV